MRVPLTKIALAACVLVSAPLPAAARAGAAPQKSGTGRPAQRRKPRLRGPDVIFVPTPPETVDEMLRQARLRKGDVLFDLGSGDGRIPLAAAKQYGVRAVGIDIDEKLVAEATETATTSSTSASATCSRPTCRGRPSSRSTCRTRST
jgi:hypothetical protein